MERERCRDWQHELERAWCGAVRGLEEFGVDLVEAELVNRRYPVVIPPYIVELMRGSGEGGAAIRRQFLPDVAELESEPGMVADPFGELGVAAGCYGVKQRFADRVLVMAHDRCAAMCRHCTRKGLLGGAEVVRTREELRVAVEWVRERAAVREVLISGGDPLLLSDEWLLEIVGAFVGLEQIDAVRIGTRVLSTLPMRVTDELAARLGSFRRVWVNTQFNHVAELTPEAVAACGRLVDAGIPVSCQSVLLAGVNDSVEALYELCCGLQRARVRPYYMFICDPVAGIKHLRVSVERARELEKGLRERVGGLALPRFVCDLPGESGKKCI